MSDEPAILRIEAAYGEADGLASLAQRFLGWQSLMHYSPATVKTRHHHLQRFVAWCADRDVLRPGEVNPDLIERYLRHMTLVHRTPNDGRLSASSISGVLSSLVAFFRWMARRRMIPSNPTADIEHPRVIQGLPRIGFTVEEMELVLRQAPLDTATGLRDRTMLEVLYATGLRRAELANLEIACIHESRSLVEVRRGKGGRDRFVPIGERALRWVRRYLDEARPVLVIPPDDGVLFLSARGQPLSLVRLSQICGDLIAAAGLRTGRMGCVHLFRHTFATQLLEHGCDVRLVQEMLGHSKLSTTARYTHVAVGHLVEAHRRCHPTSAIARQQRHARDADQEAVLAALIDESATDQH